MCLCVPYSSTRPSRLPGCPPWPGRFTLLAVPNKLGQVMMWRYTLLPPSLTLPPSAAVPASLHPLHLLPVSGRPPPPHTHVDGDAHADPSTHARRHQPVVWCTAVTFAVLPSGQGPRWGVCPATEALDGEALLLATGCSDGSIRLWCAGVAALGGLQTAVAAGSAGLSTSAAGAAGSAGPCSTSAAVAAGSAGPYSMSAAVAGLPGVAPVGGRPGGAGAAADLCAWTLVSTLCAADGLVVTALDMQLVMQQDQGPGPGILLGLGSRVQAQV